MEFDVIAGNTNLFFMKKKNQEVSKGKLKLNKERIVALLKTEIYNVKGGYKPKKKGEDNASAIFSCDSIIN